MLGTQYSSRSGTATVVGYYGSKKVLIEWESGHKAVAQLGTLRKGLVADSSIRGPSIRTARKLARDAEQVALVMNSHTIKAVKEEARKLATEARKIEREAAKLAKQEADSLLKTASKLAGKAAKELLKAERTRSAQEQTAARARKLEDDENAYVAALPINASKPRRGVLEVDFKSRAGYWILRFQRNADFIQTRLGKLHNNMISRATMGGSVQAKFNKSYSGTTASPLFQDPQTFCDWAVKQKGWGLGWQLDKDLLGSDNGHYSEDTCVFLPRQVNTLINRRGHPRIKKLAEHYKSELDPRAYEALLKL